MSTSNGTRSGEVAPRAAAASPPAGGAATRSATARPSSASATARPSNGSAAARAAEATPAVEHSTAVAEAAGLRYVSDEMPGIGRRRCGRGFSYRDASGKTIRDKRVRERIAGLVIPPAWSDVWICPYPDGHIQATGRDQAGRKQYLYHPSWRETRDRLKFERLRAFGELLPELRARVERDLGLEGLPRDKVLAVVVRLLELTGARIGHTRYKRHNGTFGLATLRRRHLEVSGGRVRLRFNGKGEREIDVEFEDAAVAKILKECEATPGYELFRYRDDDGALRTIDAEDVNGYIQRQTGGPFTAKDFRTWVASRKALAELAAAGPAGDDTEAESNVKAAVENVAELLHNTPAVCRESYIHPQVIGGYLNGNGNGGGPDKGHRATPDRPAGATLEGLHEQEVALLQVLGASQEFAAAPRPPATGRTGRAGRARGAVAAPAGC